jgi:murein L,D-transpeptidase YafK
MNLVFDRHQYRLPLLAAILWLLGGTAAQAGDVQKADRVLVLKGQRELRLLHGDTVIKTYPIALGFHPRGAKRRRGDGRTPEGVYTIDGRTTRTAYHLALHISYPNAADRTRARAAAVSPGGNILIHGMPARFGRTDPVRFIKNWTNGCVAVGNLAIEEIWAAVDNGTSIEIRP